MYDILHIDGAQYKKWEKTHPREEHVRLSPFTDWCNRHFEDIQASFPDTGIDKRGHTPACTEAAKRWHNIRAKQERIKIEQLVNTVNHVMRMFNLQIN